MNKSAFHNPSQFCAGNSIIMVELDPISTLRYVTLRTLAVSLENGRQSLANWGLKWANWGLKWVQSGALFEPCHWSPSWTTRSFSRRLAPSMASITKVTPIIAIKSTPFTEAPAITVRTPTFQMDATVSSTHTFIAIVFAIFPWTLYFGLWL